jgi:beta-phosphoglucomutase-like phosphatase (HAD superfamily)
MSFTAIGDASTAPIKKPHPQVYMQMLEKLSLMPTQCIAFEDSSNGLCAAKAAGIATLITPTRFTEHHDFRAALRVVSDLSQMNVAQVRRWHAEK